MRISIIIPVLNEEKTIASTLGALSPLVPDEILVVDGGSADRTREIAEQTQAVVISSPAGRARQMNQGARLAKGDVFLFLHADTRLPASGITDIRSALRDPQCVGGRFDLRLDREEWLYRIIGTLISLRSRLTRVATGDQAMFVCREVFEDIGGFPDIPIMEDIAFSRALKNKGRVACLKNQVITSARRWTSEGVWRTILKMWALRLLFLAGMSPFRLKRFYSDSR